ncbi:MAG TPA: hypothetical protein VGY54_02430 [Polyangiaceae bacterium]|nr:hypothetical protein [Polyangiaceae bacterium]
MTLTPRLASRTFFRVRVGILLALLGFVLLWAWRDVRSRRGRNAWDRPLSVAIVLVRHKKLTDNAVAAFRERIASLDDRMNDEFRRYRPGTIHPFIFTFAGPVDVAAGPPKASGEGVFDAAKQSWALWRWTSRVDRDTALDASAFDSRIYVAARPPVNARQLFIEGESEEGGRVGTVEVELDASMADFALFVTAHELFHTVGASDKYDAAGRTLVPEGLAEPDRQPRYPQMFAEVMARNRPLTPDVEEPPANLDELAVGPATAREIGWLR